MTDLYLQITKLNLYDAGNSSVIKPKIGPLSTLPYMVDCSIAKSDKKNINNDKIIIDHLSQLDKSIFRWRTIAGDGNCFYRAVIFLYLEHIILSKNTLLLKKIISDINEKFNYNYEKNKILSEKTVDYICNVNKSLILNLLIIIYELMINSKNLIQTFSNEESLSSAYMILLYSFVFCREFDLVTIKTIKFEINYLK